MAQEIIIGGQTWSTSNLNISFFANGDTIPEAKTNEEWKKAGSEEKPAWCYYKNKLDNGENYGKLYNWYAVNDPRGLAPVGWHIASNRDWTNLIESLGGSEVAGTKLKNTKGWKKNYGNNINGTNTSGFTANPGGQRDAEGKFSYAGFNCYWWSSSSEDSILVNEFYYEKSTFNAYNYYTYNYYGNVFRNATSKFFGYSVRCIKD